MFEHTFDIGDIQLNPVNEYYSFGTAKFKGISAYDYIGKLQIFCLFKTSPR